MKSILTNIAYAIAGLIALPVLVFLLAGSLIANCLLWVLEKAQP